MFDGFQNTGNVAHAATITKHSSVAPEKWSLAPGQFPTGYFNA
jgi:hypothetical protein